MIDLETLKNEYKALKTKHPKVRIRKAAEMLSTTEMQLLETELGKNVVRLQGDWKVLIQEVSKMKQVMALTRNDYAVHERKGEYKNISFMPKAQIGLVVGEDIDLRLFMQHWKYAYATKKEVGDRILYGFQFFDENGTAIHKIYSTPKSDLNVYYQLLEKFKADSQTGITAVVPQKTKVMAKIPKQFIDVTSFREEWKNLQDTHDFFGLIKKYKLTRVQALELAPSGYAFKISKKSIETIIETAAQKAIPIMVFVYNHACIQIHTGEVNKIFRTGEWFNIMDPMFNLHLDTSGIGQVWIVKKPTKDGIVTSVEVYEKDTEKTLMHCFGKRKPGTPELKVWVNLLEEYL